MALNTMPGHAVESPDRERLTIAFESGQITYSDLPVDLYNTGVNQILSVAAARGHAIRHFRLADLYEHEGVDSARMSILALEQNDWRDARPTVYAVPPTPARAWLTEPGRLGTSATHWPSSPG